MSLYTFVSEMNYQFIHKHLVKIKLKSQLIPFVATQSNLKHLHSFQGEVFLPEFHMDLYQLGLKTEILQVTLLS